MSDFRIDTAADCRVSIILNHRNPQALSYGNRALFSALSSPHRFPSIEDFSSPFRHYGPDCPRDLVNVIAPTN